MNSFFLKLLLSTRLKRRNLIIGAGAMTGLAIANGWSTGRVLAQPKFSDYPFKLGVASGDPFPDSVVLWTRLAPNPLVGDGGMPSVRVPVDFQVALDENMRQVVRRARVMATPESAHSVNVEVGGLEPDRWYWYQFKAGSEVSPIGRTRTFPQPGASKKQMRFAFASCQDWQNGYFNAYNSMAQEDLDFVVHLGDYIYEYGPREDTVRQHIIPEITTLEDYRIRHALYKTDADLQAVHAAFPFICTWDDHEVDNDYADENSEEFAPIPQFLERRAAAYQAYYEHLPLRTPKPRGPQMKLYRRFSFGNLAEFNVLDTRQYRTDQACDGLGVGGGSPEGGGQVVSADECSELFNPNRTMLGAEQERWLFDGLARQKALWNVLAQQYLMAELDWNPEVGKSYWTDAWDGYFSERARILDFIQNRQVSNPVVIGGDIHSFWVTELKANFLDENSPTVASEFVGTSITSSGLPYETVAAVLPDNPHVKFFESRKRGYVRCTVDRNLWTSDLRVVETIEQPTSPVNTLATFVVENGRPGPQQA